MPARASRMYPSAPSFSSAEPPMVWGRSIANPEFRPDAPSDAAAASMMTIRSEGRFSASRRAAERPAHPAPTTTQSAAISPASAGRGARGGRWAAHPFVVSFSGRSSIR